MTQINHTLYVGKVLLNLSGELGKEDWQEKIALYTEKPDMWTNDDFMKGWAFKIREPNKGRSWYLPSRALQEKFMPHIKSIEDKPVELEVTFKIK